MSILVEYTSGFLKLVIEKFSDKLVSLLMVVIFMKVEDDGKDEVISLSDFRPLSSDPESGLVGVISLVVIVLKRNKDFV